MTRERFLRLMEKEFKELVELNKRKGHDYAGDEDAFANFKRNAAALGLKPEQVWAVYAGKHWDSIMTYVREGEVQSEPIRGRIRDLALYCYLLLGMVYEKEFLEAGEELEVEEEGVVRSGRTPRYTGADDPEQNALRSQGDTS